MIKVGEIQVNKNLNPKIIIILIIASFLMFLFFSISIISIFVGTKDYIKVNATVIDVGHDKVPSSGRETISYYANLEYEYGGKKYQHKQTLYMFISYPEINSKVNIYIDPQSPSNVRNTSIIPIEVIVILISLIFNIAMIKIYLKLKK